MSPNTCSRSLRSIQQDENSPAIYRWVRLISTVRFADEKVGKLRDAKLFVQSLFRTADLARFPTGSSQPPKPHHSPHSRLCCCCFGSSSLSARRFPTNLLEPF